MKNTNTKAFKAQVDAYILDSFRAKIDGNGEEMPEDNAGIVAKVLDQFKSEYGHEIKRQNSIQGALESWLAGLALDIAFEYWEIIQLAETWHECELTQKEKDTVCERWFSFMACKIMQLAGREGVRI